jgi:undecaprenyl diphosphate synthase
MRMVEDFFVSEIDELDEKQVRIRVLGELEALPDGVRKAASDAIERTRGNAGLQLNIALNYGARDEILRAARLMAQEAAAGFLNAREAAREDFERHLYTSLQPDVDLLIRPGGERRLSNFLLYQCAYAELVFMEKLWPDFTADDFREALKAFESRERRFGGREA